MCLAVDVTGGLAGKSATCLMKAIAGRRMLARRSIASDIMIGVNFKDSANGDPCLAHAWLDVAGQTLLGGDVKAQYTVIWGRGGKPADEGA